MRKGQRKKFTICNQLYHRFTNRRKGFTPRKLSTKKIESISLFYEQVNSTFSNISVDRIYSKSKIDSKNPLSESTILSAEDLVKYNPKYYTSISCRNPEELIELSASLPSEKVALVTLNRDHVYKYTYPFHRKPYEEFSEEEDADIVCEETSSLAYPGYYYFDGYWSFLSEWDRYLPIVTQKEFVPNSSVAIYVPFDYVKTPILHAYLPLGLGMRVEEYMDIPITWEYDRIYWMGRLLNPMDYNFSPHTGDYNSLVLALQGNTTIEKKLNWDNYFSQICLLDSYATSYLNDILEEDSQQSTPQYEDISSNDFKYYFLLSGFSMYSHSYVKRPYSTPITLMCCSGTGQVPTIYYSSEKLLRTYSKDSSIPTSGIYTLWRGFVKEDKYFFIRLSTHAYMARKNIIRAYNGFFNMGVCEKAKKLVVPIGEFFDNRTLFSM